MNKRDFAILSDLHLSDSRDLLTPMIDRINNEDIDNIVILGDLANDPKFLKMGATALTSLKIKPLIIPGDYDTSTEWDKLFGARNYILDKEHRYIFLDTSFMGHRYATGWLDHLHEQVTLKKWLDSMLETDKLCVIFSHHPPIVDEERIARYRSYFSDNIRAYICGHIRKPFTYLFPYSSPKQDYEAGFITNGVEWHGNSIYMVMSFLDNGMIVNSPKVVSAKYSAW